MFDGFVECLSRVREKANIAYNLVPDWGLEQ